MLTKLKKLFTRNKSITEYINIQGYNFRVMDPAKMPNVRRAKFFMEEYKRDWGIDKSDLRAYFKAIMKETDINSTAPTDLINKMKSIHSLVATIDSVVAEDYQYKPYLLSACIIILIDGEDPNKIDPKIIAKKMKLCESIPEIEAFFLTTIRVSMSNMQGSFDMSKISNWLPSKTVKSMESILYKKINSTIYDVGNL